jgi:hypothetical protein
MSPFWGLEFLDVSYIFGKYVLLRKVVFDVRGWQLTSMVEWMDITLIREVRDSNLGPETAIVTYYFHSFSHSLQANAGILLHLGSETVDLLILPE